MSAIFVRGLEEGHENRKPDSDTEAEEGGCHSACSKSSEQEEQPTSTMTVDLPTHAPDFTNKIDGEDYSETYSSASRITPTVTVFASASTPSVTTVTKTVPISSSRDTTVTETVPAFTSSQAADTTSIDESTTSVGPTTTISISSTSADESTTSEGPTTTISISSTSTKESTFSKVGPHSTTTGKPSATITIPDSVEEFTGGFEGEWWYGQHSPTSLPPTVSSSYIEPTGDVSVVPVPGSTVFMNSSEQVTLSTNSPGLTSTEIASPPTFMTSIITILNGPTVSVDTSGGVSILTGYQPYPTTSSVSISSSAKEGYTSTEGSSTTTKSSASISSSEKGGYATAESSSATTKSSALRITSTKIYHITETSTLETGSATKSFKSTEPQTISIMIKPSTGLDPYAPAGADASTPVQHFTTTLVLPLPQALICPLGTKIASTDCTLGLQSFTTITTVTSVGPSTMLRLRRSPGHYEGIASATHARAAIKALETSLGTKDSSKIMYEEGYAATPQNPWGAASHAGQVFTEPKDFAGAISGKLVGIVIGGIFGLVCVAAIVWFGIKKVQQRRGLTKGLASKGEMEQL